MTCIQATNGNKCRNASNTEQSRKEADLRGQQVRKVVLQRLSEAEPESTLLLEESKNRKEATAERQSGMLGNGTVHLGEIPVAIKSQVHSDLV